MKTIEINTNENYWLSLMPYVHTSFDKEGNILLYNTEKGVYLISKEPRLIELILLAKEKKQLGVIELDKELFHEVNFLEEVKKAVLHKIITLQPISTQPIKPISLQPILNIQRSVEKLKQDPSRSIGEDVMKYLTTLNLYLNNKCSQDCQGCESYHKQYFCCTKNKKSENLSLSIIESLLKETSQSSLMKINILGGNILLYPEISGLIDISSQYKSKVHYWFHYKNIAECNSTILKEIKNKHIIINFPFSEKLFEKAINKTDYNHTQIYFFVENETHINLVESIMEKYNNIEYKIIPYYNGDNSLFFQENVFLEKEDILNEPISQREIFRNQTLNVNYFGSLYIFPDGEVKASQHSEALGNITQNSIYELLTLEMEKNTAWREIRQKDPCNQCLYQYLCPAPSNYEKIFCKTNLCSVR